MKLRRRIDANADAIARSLVDQHWPVSVGALERALHDIKNCIYDRRANLKNMQRVGHLLVLAQLHQMGHADERQWAAELRKTTSPTTARHRRGAWLTTRSCERARHVSDAEGPSKRTE